MAKGPNPAMRAKRVTGPSARTILLRAIACECCKVRGCTEPVLITRNPDGLTRDRACATHAVEQHRGTADIGALLAMPTRNGG